MVYDRKKNTVVVHFFPEVQYYIYQGRTVFPNQLVDKADLTLFFKTLGVRNEDNTLQHSLKIFNNGGVAKVDESFMKNT